MNKYINLLLSKVSSWKEAKANKQPLSSQNAYSISAVGKKESMDCLYDDFFHDVATDILETAKYHNTDILIHYPEWLCNVHKNKLIERLTALDYTVLFNNSDMILISWKVE